MIKSWTDAWRGMRAAWNTERNVRIEVIFIIVFIVLAWILHAPIIAVLIGVIALGTVLTAELLNTAVEKLCDHLHPHEHDSIAKVKDIAAAGVLVSAVIAAVVCGLIILFSII